MFKSKKEKTEKENLKDELKNIEINDPDEEEKTDSVKEADSDQRSSLEDEGSGLVKLEKQLTALKDQLLRKAAEFENYKRRTESDIANVYRYANEGLIAELLPVLDDFERVNKTWNDKHDTETLKKGIDLVYEKFKKTLEKQGIKEIEAVGKTFDVNLHDAILQAENDKLDADTITDEVEKGYFLKDKVLRHSKVVVSKKPE